MHWDLRGNLFLQSVLDPVAETPPRLDGPFRTGGFPASPQTGRLRQVPFAAPRPEGEIERLHASKPGRVDRALVGSDPFKRATRGETQDRGSRWVRLRLEDPKALFPRAEGGRTEFSRRIAGCERAGAVAQQPASSLREATRDRTAAPAALRKCPLIARPKRVFLAAAEPAVTTLTAENNPRRACLPRPARQASLSVCATRPRDQWLARSDL